MSDDITNPTTKDDVDVGEPVDAALADFARNLAANQEPLGEKFERILSENLWELYSRS